VKHETYTLVNSLNNERKRDLRIQFFKIIKRLNVWKGVEQEEKRTQKKFMGYL
jgi:hypothetical protein